MKLVKQLISGCLVLALSVSLMACGGKKQEPAPSANDNTATTATTAAVKEPQGAKQADSNDEVYQIKLAFASPPTHPWTKAAHIFKENVEKRTNSKVLVTVYDSGKLGTLPETTESVQAGNIEMTLMATMTMSSFVPEVQILDFPYLFPTSDIAKTILDGELGEEIKVPISKAGFYVPCFMDNDYRCISNTKKELVHPTDAKGLKIRIPETPMLSAWLQSIGANPTIIAASETYSSVQSGVADGQENGVLLTMTDKYYEVVNYFTDTNHVYGAAAVLFNQKFWDSLPAEYQAILQEECENLRDTSREMIADERGALLEEMSKTVKVHQLSDAELAEWVESGRSVYGQFRDKVDSDLLDRIIAKVDELSK